MKFTLIDHVLEQRPEHIRAVKQVSLAEEYLADHFPGFPVLPGVMMVEAMVQAARIMLADRGGSRLVLAESRAIKFGNMVRPGEQLMVEVDLVREEDGPRYVCKGVGRVRRGEASAEETAVSGKFTLRPVEHAPTVDATAGATADLRSTS